jgi:hypothetical protein
MNHSRKVGRAVGAVRRHPLRAAAICVPLVAASVFTSQSMASATLEATLPVPAAAASAPPAAHVLLFDNHLSDRPVTHMNSPKPVHVAWNVDGCDHDYGTANQCVPWQIPAAGPQADCTWLKSMGFGPLKVYGTNRQHLPENAEGYVCA